MQVLQLGFVIGLSCIAQVHCLCSSCNPGQFYYPQLGCRDCSGGSYRVTGDPWPLSIFSFLSDGLSYTHAGEMYNGCAVYVTSDKRYVYCASNYWYSSGPNPNRYSGPDYYSYFLYQHTGVTYTGDISLFYDTECPMLHLLFSNTRSIGTCPACEPGTYSSGVGSIVCLSWPFAKYTHPFMGRTTCYIYQS